MLPYFLINQRCNNISLVTISHSEIINNEIVWKKFPVRPEITSFPWQPSVVPSSLLDLRQFASESVTVIEKGLNVNYGSHNLSILRQSNNGCLIISRRPKIFCIKFSRICFLFLIISDHFGLLLRVLITDIEFLTY